MPQEEKTFNSLPIGPLGIIALESSKGLGAKVNDYIVNWRKNREHEKQDSYLLESSCPRFGSGEAKGILKESVRGDDLYLLVDVCNYSLTYSVCGHQNHMSPDDHFQDLKRIIAAISGKAKRITGINEYGCRKYHYI